MFDFAVKRLMQWQGVGFSKETFETRRVFDTQRTQTETTQEKR